MTAVENCIQKCDRCHTNERETGKVKGREE